MPPFLLDEITRPCVTGACCAQVGPAPPAANGETPAQLRKRLRGMLREFDTEAPFTLQRLCEVLLEPSKQYTRLDKLVRDPLPTFCKDVWPCTAKLTCLAALHTLCCANACGLVSVHSCSCSSVADAATWTIIASTSCEANTQCRRRSLWRSC